MLEFQLIDIWPYAQVSDDGASEQYTMIASGRTEDDKDVTVKLTGFNPYFYIELPKNWTNVHVDDFVESMKNKVRFKCRNNSRLDMDYSTSLIKHEVVCKHKFFHFTNNKVFSFIRLEFNSYTGMKQFSNLLINPYSCKKTKIDEYQFKRYEANMEPHIRFMHIRNLNPCGWVKIDLKKAKKIKYARTDYSLQVDWNDIWPAENQDRVAPLKIMGYDIETHSDDGSFSQAIRPKDAIIEFGMTIFRYGKLTSESEHILCYKQTSNVEGAHVTSYETEEELLLGIADKIAELRPDVMSGYNTFGFDDPYIKKRLEMLDRWTAEKRALEEDPNADLETLDVERYSDNIERKFFARIGKLHNMYIKKTENLKNVFPHYMERTLSSSALGDNLLKFITMPGVISIDMMKVIQREKNLDSYTLDSVSSYFIKEDIESYEIIDTDVNKLGDKTANPTHTLLKIMTKSTKALESDSYIQIMVNDGYSPSPMIDKCKYYVKDIQTEGKMQAIHVTLPHYDVTEFEAASADPLKQMYWTFAKDDIEYSIMNEYWKANDADNLAVVAKYCLKDCRLVNLLIAKLDTLINSMAMGSVCNVPLSYIFLRGQGVKIFSLVAKKCREENYLIPTFVKDNKDLNGEDYEKYEGATVIAPKPGVYDSPIAVLDYNSLYPNSMREHNMSLETYVKGKTYQNLPNYIYTTIEIVKKNAKNEVQYDLDGNKIKEFHTFAQEKVSEKMLKKEMADVISKLDKWQEEQNTRADELEELDNSDINMLAVYYAGKKNKLSPSQVVVMDEAKKIKKDPEYVTDLLVNKKLRSDLYLAIQKKRDADFYDIKMCKYNEIDGQTVRYGILPTILTELLNKRRETNDRMKATKDDFLKNILNALQLAFKITANSLYGQTGAPTSPIYFLAIAASTTAVGRGKLHHAKAIVESNFPGAKVIYGDTDSIFINFNLKDEAGNPRTDKSALIETIALASKAAQAINDSIQRPQKIVYEKTFWPFILVTKKKYVGAKYENNPDKYIIASMGISLKRRDNPPIVKIVMGGIIDNILINRSKEGAVQHVHTVLNKLVANEYHISKFIFSKRLRGDYKKPKTIVHKVLADRMGERDPGSKPSIGDRIQFVYVAIPPSKKKVMQGEMVEHPDYVIKNNLKLDYVYYLCRQIIKPASQILNLIMSEKEVTKLFEKFVLIEEGKKMKRQPLTKWMSVSKKTQEAVGNKYVIPQGDPMMNKIKFKGQTKRLQGNNLFTMIETAGDIKKKGVTLEF